MTPNPIVVNSANIIQFGLGITFDIGANTITFDSGTLTTYQTGGAANVQGIYIQVFDASGLEVKPLDLTTPDITPSAPALYILQLPNGFAQYGMFIINAIIIDQDSKQYTINLRKNICQPPNFANGVAPGQFVAQVNCDAPKVILSETTNYAYSGLQPLTITKAGNLYYPQGTLSPVAFTFTPFEITGDDGVYTGPYRIKNLTTAVYDLQDNVFVKIVYSTVLDFDVSCTSKIVDLLCCITAVEKTYYSDPNSNQGRNAKVLLDKISVPLNLAVVKDKSGQDNSAEIKLITDILQCDCGCNNQSVEPQLLTGSNAGPSFTITGQYATSVTPTVVGGSTQYVVSTKAISVTKDPADLAFNIQAIATSGAIAYKITFNYDVLAATILSTISNNQGLIDAFNALINAAGNEVSLAGLIGSCVIDLANCNYILIEPSTPTKTITSITINNTVYNAPGGLLLTNTSAIASWLNGLSLGTFTATLDGGTGNIIIQTNTNPNVITQLALTIGGNPLRLQFTAICTTLIEVLNAIIDFVCTIDSTKVAFGVASQNICTYDGSGNVVTTAVDPAIKLGALITNILNAQCALYAKIAAIVSTIGPPTGTAGGDLSGSYPNPAVNTINGVTKSFYDPTSSIQTQLNGKQASLGFTPYNSTNPANYITVLSINTLRTSANYGLTASLLDVGHYVDPGTSGDNTYTVQCWLHIGVQTGSMAVQMEVTFIFQSLVFTKIFFPQGSSIGPQTVVDYYPMPSFNIRVNPATTIQVAATVSGTGTILYECGCSIELKK